MDLTKSKKMKKDRRKFIKKATGITVATSTASILPFNLFASGRTKPNETVKIGLIGCNKRGYNVLEQHLKIPNVHCAALCDIDENVLNEKSEHLTKNHELLFL